MAVDYKGVAMTQIISASNANAVSKFVVPCLGADAWAVGVADQPIAGAVLRTREAAIRYASDLAAAAGVSRVHLDIVGGLPRKRQSTPAMQFAGGGHAT
jgi:hypothetical protein